MGIKGIKEIMKLISHHFNADEAVGVSGVVQLHFSGEQASDGCSL